MASPTAPCTASSDFRLRREFCSAACSTSSSADGRLRRIASWSWKGLRSGLGIISARFLADGNVTPNRSRQPLAMAAYLRVVWS